MDSNTLNIKKQLWLHSNFKESCFFREQCQLISVEGLRELENYHFATLTLTNESGQDHHGAAELDNHMDSKCHSTDDLV